MDNSLNLKSFKTSFSSWQNKNWNPEDTSSKDKNSKCASVEAFVIAPPPGQKRKAGSKSPTRSPKDTRPKRSASPENEAKVIQLKNVGRSSSMSFGSDSDFNKMLKPAKIVRAKSMKTDGDISIAISPISPISIIQSPTDTQNPLSRMSPYDKTNSIEASSPKNRKSMSVAKSPKSGKKVKKIAKKTSESISISVAKTNPSLNETQPAKQRSPSKTTKIEKSPSKVNKSVVMLKSSVPKEGI